MGQTAQSLVTRGIRAPVLAVGDGALGFWAALREVFPATRPQTGWFHKIGNMLSALPKSAHPGARRALAEIQSLDDLFVRHPRENLADNAIRDIGKPPAPHLGGRPAFRLQPGKAPCSRSDHP